jgi:hypothetical protein
LAITMPWQLLAASRHIGRLSIVLSEQKATEERSYWKEATVKGLGRKPLEERGSQFQTHAHQRGFFIPRSRKAAAKSRLSSMQPRRQHACRLPFIGSLATTPSQ